MLELNKKEIRGELEEIERYVESEVRFVVSPDHWYVYSQLHDELEQLRIILERNGII